MAGTKEVSFTPREMEVLALAWQCMETQPKIDINKLASLTGYTVGSAGVIFGKIKTKLKQLGEELSGKGPAPPKTPAKATPARAKATPKAFPGSDKRGAAAESTPSKRQKTTTNRRNNNTSSSNSASDSNGDDDDDEDFAGMRSGTKIKKEEPLDRSFPELDSLIHNEGEQTPASYDFLEGIEEYGGGEGRGAGGYRAPFAEKE